MRGYARIGRPRSIPMHEAGSGARRQQRPRDLNPHPCASTAPRGQRLYLGCRGRRRTSIDSNRPSPGRAVGPGSGKGSTSPLAPEEMRHGEPRQLHLARGLPQSDMACAYLLPCLIEYAKLTTGLMDRTPPGFVSSRSSAATAISFAQFSGQENPRRASAMCGGGTLAQ